MTQKHKARCVAIDIRAGINNPEARKLLHLAESDEEIEEWGGRDDEHLKYIDGLKLWLLRSILRDGIYYLPVGKGCANFSKTTGCPGHWSDGPVQTSKAPEGRVVELADGVDGLAMKGRKANG